MAATLRRAVLYCVVAATVVATASPNASRRRGGKHGAPVAKPPRNVRKALRFTDPWGLGQMTWIKSPRQWRPECASEIKAGVAELGFEAIRSTPIIIMGMPGSGTRGPAFTLGSLGMLIDGSGEMLDSRIGLQGVVRRLEMLYAVHGTHTFGRISGADARSVVNGEPTPPDSPLAKWSHKSRWALGEVLRQLNTSIDCQFGCPPPCANHSEFARQCSALFGPQGHTFCSPTFASGRGTCSHALSVPKRIACFPLRAWGYKVPDALVEVSLLRALLPRAVFVLVVRDGRDLTANKHAQQWWRSRVRLVLPATVNIPPPPPRAEVERVARLCNVTAPPDARRNAVRPRGAPGGAAASRSVVLECSQRNGSHALRPIFGKITPEQKRVCTLWSWAELTMGAHADIRATGATAFIWRIEDMLTADGRAQLGERLSSFLWSAPGVAQFAHLGRGQPAAAGGAANASQPAAAQPTSRLRAVDPESALRPERVRAVLDEVASQAHGSHTDPMTLQCRLGVSAACMHMRLVATNRTYAAQIVSSRYGKWRTDPLCATTLATLPRHNPRIYLRVAAALQMHGYDPAMACLPPKTPAAGGVAVGSAAAARAAAAAPGVWRQRLAGVQPRPVGELAGRSGRGARPRHPKPPLQQHARRPPAKAQPSTAEHVRHAPIRGGAVSTSTSGSDLAAPTPVTVPGEPTPTGGIRNTDSELGADGAAAAAAASPSADDDDDHHHTSDDADISSNGMAVRRRWR